MTEFVEQDLSGATFRQVSLRDAVVRDADARGLRLVGVLFDGMEIDGDAESLVVNGVDVMPLVEAELDRLQPGRPLVLRAETADDHRAAWAVLERLWGETVERARALPEERLHESVDGEWSFVETLRHLVFATDAWVRRAYLGDPSPHHPLGLPHDEMPETPGVTRDRTARPSLDEVLALRADRVAGVREVLATLTDADLAGVTTPVLEPGYPESESFAVRRCLGAVLHEEWHHRLFAERDLAVLESR